MKNIYFRIQPKGLDVKGHYSETSTGEISDGLHVFLAPSETFTAIWENGFRDAYGDEIVVIEAGEWWDNGDLEGVCIDPDEARILKRYSWEEWVKLWKEVIAKDYPDVWKSEKYPDFQELQDYDLEDWNDDVIAALNLDKAAGNQR